jgi:hypothetical protein
MTATSLSLILAFATASLVLASVTVHRPHQWNDPRVMHVMSFKGNYSYSSTASSVFFDTLMVQNADMWVENFPLFLSAAHGDVPDIGGLHQGTISLTQQYLESRWGSLLFCPRRKWPD